MDDGMSVWIFRYERHTISTKSSALSPYLRSFLVDFWISSQSYAITMCCNKQSCHQCLYINQTCLISVLMSSVNRESIWLSLVSSWSTFSCRETTSPLIISKNLQPTNSRVSRPGRFGYSALP